MPAMPTGMFIRAAKCDFLCTFQARRIRPAACQSGALPGEATDGSWQAFSFSAHGSPTPLAIFKTAQEILQN